MKIASGHRFWMHPGNAFTFDGDGSEIPEGTYTVEFTCVKGGSDSDEENESVIKSNPVTLTVRKHPQKTSGNYRSVKYRSSGRNL